MKGALEDVPLAVEKRRFFLPALRNVKLGSRRSPTDRIRSPASPNSGRRRMAANEPIGSGVREAACKVIVKQRLCGSGMKWTEGGGAVVLSLRTLSYTARR